ncbi:MAG: hypothetical protein IPP13_03445 [Kouleothrix sp.]|jgi:hypothetical protein|nr:hypothetical protein [Kouleothrix sp.]
MKLFAPTDLRSHPLGFTLITSTILGPFLSWLISAVFGNFLFSPWGQPEGVMLRFLSLGIVSGIGIGLLIVYLLRKHSNSPLRWLLLSIIVVAVIMGGLGWIVEGIIRTINMPFYSQ